jgi:hypothetical protein
MAVLCASGAHVRKAHSAPVLANHHFRHVLIRNQRGADGLQMAVLFASGAHVPKRSLRSVGIQMRMVCNQQFAALPVLMNPKVHSAPGLANRSFRLILI